MELKTTLFSTNSEMLRKAWRELFANQVSLEIIKSVVQDKKLEVDTTTPPTDDEINLLQNILLPIYKSRNSEDSNQHFSDNENILYRLLYGVNSLYASNTPPPKELKKYLISSPDDESNENLKKYEEAFNKFVEGITKNPEEVGKFSQEVKLAYHQCFNELNSNKIFSVSSKTNLKEISYNSIIDDVKSTLESLTFDESGLQKQAGKALSDKGLGMPEANGITSEFQKDYERDGRNTTVLWEKVSNNCVGKVEGEENDKLTDVNKLTKSNPRINVLLSTLAMQGGLLRELTNWATKHFNFRRGEMAISSFNERALNVTLILDENKVPQKLIFDLTAHAIISKGDSGSYGNLLVASAKLEIPLTSQQTLSSTSKITYGKPKFDFSMKWMNHTNEPNNDLCLNAAVLKEPETFTFGKLDYLAKQKDTWVSFISLFEPSTTQKLHPSVITPSSLVSIFDERSLMRVKDCVFTLVKNLVKNFYQKTDLSETAHLIFAGELLELAEQHSQGAAYLREIANNLIKDVIASLRNNPEEQNPVEEAAQQNKRFALYVLNNQNITSNRVKLIDTIIKSHESIAKNFLNQQYDAILLISSGGKKELVKTAAKAHVKCAYRVILSKRLHKGLNLDDWCEIYNAHKPNLFLARQLRDLFPKQLNIQKENYSIQRRDSVSSNDDESSSSGHSSIDSFVSDRSDSGSDEPYDSDDDSHTNSTSEIKKSLVDVIKLIPYAKKGDPSHFISTTNDALANHENIRYIVHRGPGGKTEYFKKLDSDSLKRVLKFVDEDLLYDVFVCAYKYHKKEFKAILQEVASYHIDSQPKPLKHIKNLHKLIFGKNTEETKQVVKSANLIKLSQRHPEILFHLYHHKPKILSDLLTKVNPQQFFNAQFGNLFSLSNNLDSFFSEENSIRKINTALSETESKGHECLDALFNSEAINANNIAPLLENAFQCNLSWLKNRLQKIANDPINEKIGNKIRTRLFAGRQNIALAKFISNHQDLTKVLWNSNKENNNIDSIKQILKLSNDPAGFALKLKSDMHCNVKLKAIIALASTFKQSTNRTKKFINGFLPTIKSLISSHERNPLEEVEKELLKQACNALLANDKLRDRVITKLSKKEFEFIILNLGLTPENHTKLLRSEALLNKYAAYKGFWFWKHKDLDKTQEKLQRFLNKINENPSINERSINLLYRIRIEGLLSILADYTITEETFKQILDHELLRDPAVLDAMTQSQEFIKLILNMRPSLSFVNKLNLLVKKNAAYFCQLRHKNNTFNSLYFNLIGKEKIADLIKKDKLASNDKQEINTLLSSVQTESNKDFSVTCQFICRAKGLSFLFDLLNEANVERYIDKPVNEYLQDLYAKVQSNELQEAQFVEIAKKFGNKVCQSLLLGLKTQLSTLARRELTSFMSKAVLIDHVEAPRDVVTEPTKKSGRATIFEELGYSPNKVSSPESNQVSYYLALHSE